MNGAHVLLDALVKAGVEICFANPGTSEMHLVTAIGKTDQVRSILCLFEGVVSGAADGYSRMSGKPAVTLLHLGPGYANSMANMHNARKGFSSMVNIVGDHAVWHLQYDAPLTSDVVAHAELHSHWVRVTQSSEDLSFAGAEAVATAKSGWGKIATLIVPANHAWEPASKSYDKVESVPPTVVSPRTVEKAAEQISSVRKTAILLGGHGMLERSLVAAGRVAEATGATLLSETFPRRLQRGAGRVAINRIPYFAEHAIEFLRDYEQIILFGAKQPVGFFAYPGVPSLLAPENCEIVEVAGVDDNVEDALESLARVLGAKRERAVQERTESDRTEFQLTPSSIGEVISRHLPADAIISDEAITCAAEIFEKTVGAERHDWLAITGGSIGQGLPVSLGASIACPGRKVVSLQADGSAMYTAQALWTMAREGCDCAIILLNNNSYAILNVELERLRTEEPNAKTLSMLDLGDPQINWVSIAEGMGVTAFRSVTATEFDEQFAEAMRIKGPRLIEVMVNQ